jgi:hypothetical protein
MVETLLRPARIANKKWSRSPELSASGAKENSPAIHRWERAKEILPSPGGAAEPHLCRPSGTLRFYARNPQLKLRAIVGRRCATEAKARARGAGIADNRPRGFAYLAIINLIHQEKYVLPLFQSL